MQRWLEAVLITIVLAGLQPATGLATDDDILGHELYRTGDYVRAAEVFVDPAWKGMALYRSEQWWRAAEAFLQADDPVSNYNLGNCYVRLGYPALALDAYQRALATRPGFADARFNAALMRKLLESEATGESGGMTQDREAIDRISSEESAGRSDAAAGEEDSEASEASGSDKAEPTAGRQQRQDSNSAGETASQQHPVDEPASEPGAGEVNGQALETTDAERPAGGSESEAAQQDSQSAGRRGDSEGEQATEQWLNRIEHDPARFLEKRIALEQRRRRAAGQPPPDGGDGW